MTDFESYQSPLSWRYGSPEMRQLWSEVRKRLLWRQIWVALARAELSYGLVSPAQLADLEENAGKVDIARSLEIEAEIHHDLMAELRVYAEQSPLGGPILHLGATSTDIEDNADALRIRASLGIISKRLEETLLVLAEKIDVTANLPVMAFTHMQPAEPTTLGYRLAGYAQDLWECWKTIQNLQSGVRGKGFKGAVGSAAAYGDLIGIDNFESFESALSNDLGLPFFSVTTQTYPRRQDYEVVSALAGIGAVLHKLAFDLRFLQSPPMGELSEPFAAHQVGSSAMPFKRNPVNAEKIDSLARQLAGLPVLAWHNAANALLERTLDDSANRRSLLPEAFLLSDELLITSHKILKGLVVNKSAIQRNLATFAPFAALERVLMAAVKRGADRQLLHEVLRRHALAAWEQVQSGQPNNLIGLVKSDPAVTRWLPNEELDAVTDITAYTGLAASRALWLAGQIRTDLAQALARQGG